MTVEPVRANTTPTDPFSFEDPRFAGVDNAHHKDDLPELPDDGWADPGFEAIRNATSRKFVEDLGAIADTDPDSQAILDAEAAEAIAAAVPPVVAPVVTAPVVVPAPVPEEPEVIEFENGGSATIEKTAKGWSVSIDSNTGGGVEVFHGKTKDEMYRQVLSSKVHLNRKLRDVNRQLKLGRPETVQPATPAPKTHELTADETFELKTQLQNNPDLALQTWFQKKTGKTVEQLLALAQKGEAADEKLRIEQEARTFRSEYLEYYPTDENLHALDDYLAKNNLEWNAKNLGTAFEELSEAGLLDIAPKTVAPKPAPAPAPVVQATPVAATPAPAPAPPAAPAPAAPPPTDPRIAGVRRRSRAGLGIRENETTSTPIVDDKPPSDEELDNLSNDEINQLFAGVRRLRAQSARR
jgi:hypothetical protein